MKKLFCALLCLCAALAALPAAPALAADAAYAESLAAGLKTLGLFEGVSDTEFDLERPPTRTEALVMLIRTLGRERDARSGTWPHPFTDVAEWADPYVGYAYQNGLADGISDTEYGGGDAGAATYLTFMLRALGYSDKGDSPDFTWENPYQLAASAGLMPAGISSAGFDRSDVVLVSYAALSAKLKGSDRTLADKLIGEGVFSREQFDALRGGETASGTPAPAPAETPPAAPSGRTAMTAEEIYALCSPAVFCIMTYDAAGQPLSQASGFFIDAGGVAVTNYHVVQNAASAQALLTDGRALAVSGMVYGDAGQDYAVILVDGSGFPVLAVGDSSSVKGGEQIFTIGNPQGMTNTISDGIISNPKSVYKDMIQFSAPISAGSSGGALLNAYGEVVGITTGAFEDAQNLNLAVPVNTALREGGPAQYVARYGLSALPGSMPSVSASAFAALKNFVLLNYNDTLGDGSPCWFLTLGDTEYGLVYTDGQLVLSLLYAAWDGVYGSTLFVEENGAAVYAACSYYAGNASTATAAGSAVIRPGGVYPGAPYAFTGYEGAPQYRRPLEAGAMDMFCESLAFADYLLAGYTSPAGIYTVADLGFVNYW